MSTKIALITDYLGRFGSKQKSQTYRSGFDIEKSIKFFQKHNCEVKIINFTNALELLKEKQVYFILYTSSEDKGDHYKSFIEDTVQLLSLSHHICIPEYIFLRAHNNKVFMEMLRLHYDFSDKNLFKSKFVATKKEISSLDITFPSVVKGADGALSKNVKKVKDFNEVYRFFSSIAPKLKSKHILREYLRRIRHRNNYDPEELKRGKIIIQDFIPNIKFDWKVLVYNDMIFVLKRQNRKNDFRASGSGIYDYFEKVPKNILDFAWNTRKKLDVPHLSLDIAESNNQLIIFEFQAIYFGTKTIENSPFHFVKEQKQWHLKQTEVELEEVYVNSTMSFIKNKFL